MFIFHFFFNSCSLDSFVAEKNIWCIFSSAIVDHFKSSEGFGDVFIPHQLNSFMPGGVIITRMGNGEPSSIFSSDFHYALEKGMNLLALHWWKTESVTIKGWSYVLFPLIPLRKAWIHFFLYWWKTISILILPVHFSLIFIGNILLPTRMKTESVWILNKLCTFIY